MNKYIFKVMTCVVLLAAGAAPAAAAPAASEQSAVASAYPESGQAELAAFEQRKARLLERGREMQGAFAEQLACIEAAPDVAALGACSAAYRKRLAEIRAR